MFVIPKDGLKVMDPVRRDYLPLEGRNVNDDNLFYWDRHRQDGAVEVLTDPAKIKEAEARLEKADQDRAKEMRDALAKAEADTAKKDAKAPEPKPVAK